MPAYRCSTCGIDYPNNFTYKKCRVCGEPTSGFSNIEADPNWQDKVDLASIQPDVKPDPVVVWREEQLLSAGYSPGSSAQLADDKTLDLHKAVELAHKAGPELAYRILS
jgi:hypothetical protein